jgi:phosphoheptose isomerase
VMGAAIATGSVVLWVAGPAAATALGVAGGLVGALSTRGLEKEIANYYQQAVLEGLILVAIEAQGEDREQRLSQAADIFAAAGAKPIRLPEG